MFKGEIQRFPDRGFKATTSEVEVAQANTADLGLESEGIFGEEGVLVGIIECLKKKDEILLRLLIAVDDKLIAAEMRDP